jgi:hypothetical protein
MSSWWSHTLFSDSILLRNVQSMVVMTELRIARLMNLTEPTEPTEHAAYLLLLHLKRTGLLIS